jgi:hypothetical protein
MSELSETKQPITHTVFMKLIYLKIQISMYIWQKLINAHLTYYST